MVFGDVGSTKVWQNDSRIEVHGPGYSKLVIGEDACLPAGQRTAALPSVHKHVDDLCAMVLNLCVHSGNAGDSAAGPQSEQGLYLGER